MGALTYETIGNEARCSASGVGFSGGYDGGSLNVGGGLTAPGAQCEALTPVVVSDLVGGGTGETLDAMINRFINIDGSAK